jgi:hypothetical protein
MPYQLNIVGSLSTTGSASISGPLNIAGGITPIYTTPSFTSGQVGGILSASMSGSTNAIVNAGVNLLQISNIPSGVWIANWRISTNTATDGYWQTQFAKNGSNIDNLTFCSTVSARAYNTLSSSWIFSTATNDYVYVTASAGVGGPYSIYNGTLQLIRIA